MIHNFDVAIFQVVKTHSKLEYNNIFVHNIECVHKWNSAPEPIHEYS